MKEVNMSISPGPPTAGGGPDDPNRIELTGRVTDIRRTYSTLELASIPLLIVAIPETQLVDIEAFADLEIGQEIKVDGIFNPDRGEIIATRIAMKEPETEPPKRRSTAQSFAIGIVIAMTLAAIIQLAMNEWIYWQAGIPLFTLILFLPGLRRIKIAHVGARTILGRRVRKYLFDEGYQWVIPGIESFVEVSIQKETQKLDDVLVYTQDNVPVNVKEASLFNQITDPYAFLDITEETRRRGLGDVFEQLLREYARRYNLADFLKFSFYREFQQALIDGAIRTSRGWGLSVTGLPVPKLEPDPEMLKTLQGGERERLEQNYQLREAETASKIADIIAGDPPNMTREAAMRLAYDIIGKWTTERVVLEGGVPEAVTAFLAGRIPQTGGGRS